MADWDEAKFIINQVLEGVNLASTSGIPPQNMTNFSVSGENARVKITANVPANTIIDGQLICTVAGVKIVRKISSAPIGPNDGTLIADLKAGASYNGYDNNLVNGVTYFYGFYPYSDHGVYNFNKANVLSATPTPVKYWAFRQNFADKNPATTISYPAGYTNSNFAKMLTNEGAGTATYGGWQSFLRETLKNFPAMCSKDGKMAYQLNEDDYDKKKSGGASDCGNTSYAGGAFAWLNRIYMKETYETNGRLVEFADAAVDGFTPVGFYDMDGNILNGIWLPMGLMDSSGRTLVKGTTACYGQTCDGEKNIMSGFWGSRGVFLGGPIMHVLRDLEYMLFKSTDIQATAGNGQCMLSSSESHPANEKVANGNVKGWKGTNTKNVRNKYFHSQVLGSYDRWLRDPYTLLVGGALKMSYNYKYDITGASYINTGRTWSTGGWNYPSSLESLSNKHLGSMPKFENTGSTSTGLCDGVYGNASGTRVAIRLGSTNDDLMDGPALVHLNDEAGNAHWSYGASVILLPPAGYDPGVA